MKLLSKNNKSRQNAGEKVLEKYAERGYIATDRSENEKIP